VAWLDFMKWVVLGVLEMAKISVVIPSVKPEVELQGQVDQLHRLAANDLQVVTVCKKQSAAKNRNECIEKATSSLIIMMDDDITGFYPGWDKDLVSPFDLSAGYSIISARVLNREGKVSATAGMLGGSTMEGKIQEAECLGLNIVCSACISFIKSDIRFDEVYIGSGYEDTDFCMQHIKGYPEKKIVINNSCKLIHLNEGKGQQGTQPVNRAHFIKKWGNIL